MKIALAQMNISADRSENVQKTLSCMEESISLGAQVICFPEVQLTPFFPQYEHLDVKHHALDIDHNIIKQIRDKCAKLNLVAIPNIYLEEDGAYYDASIVIDANGEIKGISKMVHIVRLPKFYEQDYYKPSNNGFRLYNTTPGKIGLVICYDRHFPESIRSCVLQGAELIVIPTANTIDEDLDMFEWELRVQAMQNNVFIAMCNRVGLEGNMDFCGHSIVVDPHGQVIKKADNKQQLLIVNLDLKTIIDARKQRPYLQLRAPSQYQWLMEN